MRKFEIVKDEFIKYGEKDVVIPHRSTKFSAGYDMYSPSDVIIPAGGIGTVWTNIKVACNSDEFVMICVRSSIGRKGLCLANDVGIIDSDYYGNPETDGNIGIMLRNTTTNDFAIKKGDKIAQAIFMKYLTVDGEEEILASRRGAFGSTGK